MKRLLLVALMVLMTLVGMVGFSRAADKEIQTAITQVQNIQMAVQELPATVNTGVPAKAKLYYYLTTTGFTGDEAITACDSGYHMASLSEIQDPSNVQYAPGHKLVYAYSDQVLSNQFPDHTGWVRTKADPLTGYAFNCDVWRPISDQQSGTMMTRRSLLGENNGHSLYEESDPAAWWQSTRTASCAQPKFVWCVEDPEYWE